MLEEPLVTVVICVYNAGPYLRPSLESVLNQTHRNLEVLIINDGSTDGCMETIRDISDPRVRVINQENSGKPTAMNRAIHEMRGEFYAIQDADDISDKRRIERLLACMRAHPEVAGVFSGHDILLDDKRSVAPRFRDKGKSECKADIDRFQMPAHDPTAMYRLSMVREFPYGPTLGIADGLDYTLRTGEEYPLMVVGECLYSYRVHLSSITKRDPAKREKRVEQVMRRACERRGISYDAAFPVVRKRGKHQMADNNLAADFIESVLDQRRIGRRWGAVCTGWTCLWLHPFEGHYYKAMIYAIVPMWLARRFRRSQG